MGYGVIMSMLHDLNSHICPHVVLLHTLPVVYLPLRISAWENGRYWDLIPY